MVDLTKFTLKVTSEYEMNVAVRFYMLCTGFAQASNSYPWRDGYGDLCVGVYWPGDTSRDLITVGVPTEHETIVPMSNIIDLADTPQRLIYLAEARLHASTFANREPNFYNPDGEI